MSQPIAFHMDATRNEPATPAAPRVAASWMVPVLYDRLVQSLRLADAAIAADVTVRGGLDLERSSTIVFELLSAVNFQQGGELAPRLAALYGYFASEILVLSRTHDRAHIAQLIDMIQVLSGSWGKVEAPGDHAGNGLADVINA